MIEKRGNKLLYFRLRILFIIVILLFSILIIRLGNIQIVQGEEFRAESQKTTKTVFSWNTPRGKIYDRNGNVLVENKAIYTLTYTNPSNDDSQQEKLDLAKTLAGIITMTTEKVTERDKKDYWILTRKQEAYAKLTSDEQKNLNDNEEYQLILERITQKDLASIPTDEMEVLAIKREMDVDSSSANRIKSGLTVEEIAIVNERLEDLPGVEVKIDSERNYVYGDTLRQLFGNVGQIPEEEAESYKSEGYALSDMVGTSFLEQQYEEILRGTKEKQTYVEDITGAISDVKLTPGEPGKDLMLTIDLPLQQELEKVIEEELKDTGATSAYVVMSNPATGEILAIAGKKEVDNQLSDELYGAFYNSYAMGSAVKGATVLTGYETGVISPGDTFVDSPIKISGTPIKKSYVNMGTINDLTALERSSNVYMFHIAMKIGDYDYARKLGFKNPEKAYEMMRKYFGQFGLGVKTEIDLPDEATGYNGGVQKLGNLMDFSIGQFDTYTPLQLLQYVSTIANDGERVQPHFMKEVLEPSNENGKSGEVIEEFQTNTLNTVDMDLSYIERVQNGFHLVMNGNQGTATSAFKGATYDPAGKTGTAQVSDGSGGYNYNLTLVGYAPYENPEVAISVVVPNVENDSSGINKSIGRRILDYYFQNK